MYDIAIIGSGPAGLSAAIYGKRAGKNIVVIEKDMGGAGQITLGGKVDNYLGFPSLSGIELGEAFKNHAKAADINIINKTVTKIELDNGTAVFKLSFTDGEAIDAENIIYATGAAHRKLGIEGEEELTGAGVSYCATCDGAFYKGSDIIVNGGGNTAVDDALYLSEIAASVTLIHRRDQFRAAKESLEKLRNKDNVKIITGVTINKILGEDEVEGVILSNGEEVATEGVFIAVGMEPRTELVKDLVDLDEAGYIIAAEDGKTSLKGFYAAGDVRTKALRQVVTAVSDGANCINSILNA